MLTNDDVAVEDSTYTTGRRGVAGTLVVEKIVGAAAESGADLEACRTLGVRINERTASMGVALTSCTVPEAGRPTFDIDDDQMEMGSESTANRVANGSRWRPPTRSPSNSSSRF